MSPITSHVATTPFITVTELDYVRLHSLIASLDDASPAIERLEQADQVPSDTIPGDVITMHTQVRVQDLDGGDVRTLTLCYPKEADPSKGNVSVLSPIGASLLGSRAPGRVSWVAPDGAEHALDVVEIVFQPEANGDYTA
jgi:regulator of nucleoside diphosphate kinase